MIKHDWSLLDGHGVNYDELVQEITDLREATGRSQTEYADRLGVTRRTIIRYENGIFRDDPMKSGTFIRYVMMVSNDYEKMKKRQMDGNFDYDFIQNGVKFPPNIEVFRLLVTMC